MDRRYSTLFHMTIYTVGQNPDPYDKLILGKICQYAVNKIFNYAVFRFDHLIRRISLRILAPDPGA